MKEITVTFGEKYETLPIPNRSGYTFFGLLSREGVPVLSGGYCEDPKRPHLICRMNRITSERVETVFVPNDLSKKNVEVFVKGIRVPSSMSSRLRHTSQRD